MLFGFCIVIVTLGADLSFVGKMSPHLNRGVRDALRSPCPSSAGDWGQRMLRIYGTYGISERKSAVTLLINTTRSRTQEICPHSSRNPRRNKQTEKGFPSLLASSTEVEV